MPRALPTLAILLLLVGQGLLTTSGLWHRHGPTAGELPGHAASNHGACHHGHHHGEHPGRGDREPAPAHDDDEHDDDCAVCLIVATQRMAVLPDGHAVALAAVTERITLPEAQAPGRPTRGPPRSRGPPPLNRA